MMQAEGIDRTLSAPASRGRLLRYLVVGVIIGYSALHFGYSLWRYGIWDRDASTIVYGADVRRPWMEARRWKAGGALVFGEVIYPPFYYALMVPWTALDYRVVEPIFYVSQFFWYVLALWLMVKSVFDKAPPVMAYVWATVLTVNFTRFLKPSRCIKSKAWRCASSAWRSTPSNTNATWRRGPSRFLPRTSNTFQGCSRCTSF